MSFFDFTFMLIDFIWNLVAGYYEGHGFFVAVLIFSAIFAASAFLGILGCRLHSYKVNELKKSGPSPLLTNPYRYCP